MLSMGEAIGAPAESAERLVLTVLHQAQASVEDRVVYVGPRSDGDSGGTIR